MTDPVARTLRLLPPLLHHLELTPFIGAEDGSGPGCFHFRTPDPLALRARLTADPRFAGVSRVGASWQAREIGARGVLHLKHFAGWPEDRVQAHIDPWGARPHAALWLCPPIPLGLLLAHALDPRGYRHLDRVEASLRRRGFAAEGSRPHT